MPIFVDVDAFMADSAAYEEAAVHEPVFITQAGKIVYILCSEVLVEEMRRELHVRQQFDTHNTTLFRNGNLYSLFKLFVIAILVEGFLLFGLADPLRPFFVG